MPLTPPQSNIAAQLVRLAAARGLPLPRAREFSAAAGAESSWDPAAVNPKSGAAGLYQLLSSGYRTKAQQLGGLTDWRANAQAILPDYLSYWRQHPRALPGEAGRDVERSGEGAGFYTKPLGLLPSVGAPAFAAGPAAPAAPPPITSARAAAPTFKAPNVEALTQALLAGKPIGGLLGRPAAPTGAVNADTLTNTLLAGRPIGRMLAPPPASQPGPLPLAQPRTVTQPSGGYPLATRGKVIGVPYQGTHTLYGNWESDNAVDLATPAGTPVVALADGTIGPQIGPLSASGDPRLAGLRVHLVTPGNEFYYAHLSRLAVKAGQKVKAGQIIGYSGAANGVQHLHFAQRSGNPLKLVA